GRKDQYTRNCYEKNSLVIVFLIEGVGEGDSGGRPYIFAPGDHSQGDHKGRPWLERATTRVAPTCGLRGRPRGSPLVGEGDHEGRPYMLYLLCSKWGGDPRGRSANLFLPGR